MTLANFHMHDNCEDVGELPGASSHVAYFCVAYFCVIVMHRCLADCHVRPSVWLQRNTDGRDVEGGYHQTSALGQYLHRCCLDYEDLTLEVLPTPHDAHQ